MQTRGNTCRYTYAATQKSLNAYIQTSRDTQRDTDADTPTRRGTLRDTDADTQSYARKYAETHTQ